MGKYVVSAENHFALSGRRAFFSIHFPPMYTAYTKGYSLQMKPETEMMYI